MVVWLGQDARLVPVAFVYGNVDDKEDLIMKVPIVIFSERNLGRQNYGKVELYLSPPLSGYCP